MQEFWINYGYYFIAFEGIAICMSFFSLNFYTGIVKKLDLMAKDIKSLGSVREEVLDYDRITNRGNLDPLGMSLFTHLIYFIPSKDKNPKLYENENFLDQLSEVKIFRKIYAVVGILLLLDLCFIFWLSCLYGSNIK